MAIIHDFHTGYAGQETCEYQAVRVTGTNGLIDSPVQKLLGCLPPMPERPISHVRFPGGVLQLASINLNSSPSVELRAFGLCRLS